MKIGDFGLARDIDNDSNYVVRGNVSRALELNTSCHSGLGRRRDERCCVNKQVVETLELRWSERQLCCCYRIISPS